MGWWLLCRTWGRETTVIAEAEATINNSAVAVSPLRAATKPWMVLHTKSRQEKAVARYLTAVGAVFYLPLITRVTLVRNRKLRSRVDACARSSG